MAQCLCASNTKKMLKDNIPEGESHQSKIVKIKATVLLMKKHVLDMNNFGASLLDRVYEFFGKGFSFQLISSTHSDTGNRSRGKLGKPAILEKWISSAVAVNAGEAAFGLRFEWDESMGVPGAFIVKNHHHSQFYLKTVTLDDVPNQGRIHFVCNSWVYPAHRYAYNRVFFPNKTLLPCNMPEPLRQYREEELANLCGTGKGMLKECDRVYDYDYYNDLGFPDKGREYSRPVLGGSGKYPYPRRGRTGRKPTKSDPNSETRLPLASLNIYVPRDEKFNAIKMSDFLASGVKAIVQVLVPELASLFDKTINEFDSFDDVMNLYERGLPLPNGATLKNIRDCIPFEMFKELLRSDGERFLKFPVPDVIKADKSAWRTDEEFSREMLAGLNPVIVCRLREFPPTSTLDPNVYGEQNSKITKEHVEKHMNGLKVEETYASRTVLLLQDDVKLKPLAIELSLPHGQGDQHGAVSQVYTPGQNGLEGSIWQLAKAYAAVNDSGYHQLISHWLHTHAAIEPFVIATNRQLSVVHPIHKLLHPHFRDTMNINALARQILINAGGILEMTVFPAKYAMEMSSAVYKNWVFTDHALPADLLKRGMAVAEPNSPHGLKLLVEDYPYAVDGLEIWFCIETWVKEYCSLYYTSNDLIQNDPELQAWWSEIRNIGHGDLKDKPWWPEMSTLADLTHTCCIIIWVASALHAAVNFGQYSYAGFLPNHPTVSRRFMPQPGSVEYAELESNPDLAFLKTITAQLQTLLGVSLIEGLSRHSSDEIAARLEDSLSLVEESPIVSPYEEILTVKESWKLVSLYGKFVFEQRKFKLRKHIFQLDPESWSQISSENISPGILTLKQSAKVS
ncbi:hypothetical protein QQ045_012633 [Rhodiola kirilowii]